MRSSGRRAGADARLAPGFVQHPAQQAAIGPVGGDVDDGDLPLSLSQVIGWLLQLSAPDSVGCVPSSARPPPLLTKKAPCRRPIVR